MRPSTWTSSSHTAAWRSTSWSRLQEQMPWKVRKKLGKIWAIPFKRAWNLFKVPCRTFLLKCPGRLSLVGLVNIWPAQVSVWNVLETPPPCHQIQLETKNKTKVGNLFSLKTIQIWYWDKYTITIADKYVGCNGEAGTSLLHLPILVEPLSPANTWANSKI